jgi:hypothetical protein
MSDTNAGDEKKATERRREERSSVSIPAMLTVENRVYPCIVLNMSKGGLLLKFDSRSDLSISNDDTGKTGTVAFGIEKSQKSFRSKIVRVLLSDNIRVAALSIIG